MENCKESVEITMRATFLDVTPEDGGASVMNHGDTSDTPVFSASADAAGDAAADSGSESGTGGDSALDPELVAAGERVFRKCSACHAVGEGADHKTGPHLNDLMGRTMGGLDDYRYSDAFEAAASEGRVWDAEALTAFLADPKGYMDGTKMSFPGLKKEDEQAALAAYLQSFAD